MNSDNSVCQFYLRNICRFGDECLKRHEKPSCSKHEPSVRTCEIAASSYQLREGHSNVQQELTDEPTAHDVALNTTKDVNKIQPEKWTNTPTNQDLIDLKSENEKLVKKFNTLETTVNTLHEQLKNQKKENADLINVLNKMELHDEDFKCPVCFELFIVPSLLSCSHMFCEWCIDKMLEKSDKCPICRKQILQYTYCLNTANIIKRMIERMPEKVKLKYEKVEASRSKDKPKSLQLRAEREKLELIRIELNGHVFRN
ncbi:nuclear factor 7, brain-like [Melanaphis sacchari]|uniref:nuclear factor 7, brain-like n=1 Tax=Melanaphis sacchari TaxID=742174 RepID=UPI000DC15756|nr:nuclear factor 7, brain-like [Melanaphis sacchari]